MSGLRIDGIGRLAIRLDSISRGAARAAAGACEAGAALVLADIRGGRNVRRDSGELDAGWSITTDEAAASATLSNDAPHARALEYGFHGVVAARSRSGRVYARRANVPERRFLRGAVESTRGRLGEAANAEFRRRIIAG